MPKLQHILVSLLLLCSGCLITSNSETTHNGTRVSTDTFAQIKPGSTTSIWVEATLGPPTSKNKTDTDEVWKYVYSEHTNSDGAVFLLFGGSSSTDKSEICFIEFKDGVVTNKWRG